MEVKPQLMFSGRCDEALNVYRAAASAQPVMLIRLKKPWPAAHAAAV